MKKFRHLAVVFAVAVVTYDEMTMMMTRLMMKIGLYCRNVLKDLAVVVSRELGGDVN